MPTKKNVITDPVTGKAIDLSVPGENLGNESTINPGHEVVGTGTGDNPHTPEPIERTEENKSVDFDQPTTQPATGASPTDAPNVGSNNDAMRNPGMPTPGEVASDIAKNALASTSGAVVPESNKAQLDKINETKSDNPDVRHANADTPPELKDGRKARYVAGRRVLITDEKYQQYLDLVKKYNDSVEGRDLNDLPAGHDSNQIQKELDAFVAQL